MRRLGRRRRAREAGSLGRQRTARRAVERSFVPRRSRGERAGVGPRRRAVERRHVQRSRGRALAPWRRAGLHVRIGFVPRRTIRADLAERTTRRTHRQQAIRPRPTEGTTRRTVVLRRQLTRHRRRTI
ncbi:hypothetical protein SAMN05421805_120116, partial [Saccharopolyspora antimicrobica]